MEITTNARRAIRPTCLEEKCDTCRGTLIADVAHPCRVNRPVHRAAFADDHPRDAIEI
jgi:hypothetical protein